jgi:hypothetical protein
LAVPRSSGKLEVRGTGAAVKTYQSLSVSSLVTREYVTMTLGIEYVTKRRPVVVD